MTAFGGIEISVSRPQQATVELVPLSDPTGELNALVWETMGHMRGSFSHCQDADSHTLDDSSAVRYPRAQVITIPRPTNLQLNELYWPTLMQHASELWVVVPCKSMQEIGDLLQPQGGESRIKVSLRLAAYRAYVAGIWQLDQHKAEEIRPAGAENDPAFRELALICFTDGRFGHRDRLEFINTNLDVGEVVLETAENTSFFLGVPSLSGLANSTGRWISRDGYEYFVPCRMSAFKTKPIFTVWADSTNIGLGNWPVCVPTNTEERFVSLQYLPHTSLPAMWSAYNQSGEVSSLHTAVLQRPNNTHAQNTREKISSDPSSWPFVSSIMSVNGMARRNGISAGNRTLVASNDTGPGDKKVSSRASTALFVNVNTDGQYTGRTNDQSIYTQWLKIQNDFRYLASTRPGRKLLLGNTGDDIFNANDYWGLFSSGSTGQKLFPPSAWIVRPAAVSRVMESRPETFTDLDTTLNATIEVEELPWIASGLPSEFPITWKPQYSEVDWIDSGQVGEMYKVYHNFGNGRWYRKPPSTLGDTIENRRVIGFQYRCEAVRYIGYSVLTPEQVDALPDWCESESLACYPPVFGGYQMETYYWHQRPCTAMIIRTNRNSPFPTDTQCWEMVWGASWVYRINPPPDDEPDIPTPPSQPPDEPVEPQPGLPVPGYGG